MPRAYRADANLPPAERYPSDLSDAEWVLIEPLLAKPPQRGPESASFSPSAHAALVQRGAACLQPRTLWNPSPRQPATDGRGRRAIDHAQPARLPATNTSPAQQTGVMLP